MYELKSRVRFSETDENGVLTLWGMMNYLQDCCTMQAEDLGIGFSYLRENHLGWIVTSYQIKIKGELPEIGDEIVVKTWPYHFRGMFGYRNFTIEDVFGNTIVEADSLWLLMDLQQQKPVRLPEKMKEAYQLSPQLQGQWDIRKKLVMDGGEQVDSFTVSKMHLDTNHHMNNAKYIEAAASVISAPDEIREIWIAYKKQARYQDQVLCVRKDLEGGAVVGLTDEKGEEYCVVEFCHN